MKGGIGTSRPSRKRATECQTRKATREGKKVGGVTVSLNVKE